MHPDWLIPDWPASAHVHAVCTTRAGGRSVAPYDSLNLGDHVGDAPLQVAGNRQLLQEALGARPVFLRQVHGRKIAALDAQAQDGIEADACTTTERALACTIMVADCLPVLLTDAAGTAVGAAHAGWRGLAGEGAVGGAAQGGVLEAVHERLLAIVRAQSSHASVAHTSPELIAWLGPCIGPESFEVGPEVRAAFVTHDARTAALFHPHREGKWLADLQGLARLRLQALGVTRIFGNDGSRAWCTVANSSRFFSHRRDSARLGGSGRFAACIWLG